MSNSLSYLFFVVNYRYDSGYSLLHLLGYYDGGFVLILCTCNYLIFRQGFP